MNRDRRLDRKTEELFEHINTYFIDVFYNGHYGFARNQVKEGRAQSVTDAYKSAIRSYVIAINDGAHFKTAIKGLHHWYQSHSGFSSLLLSDFEDLFLSKMIPAEYYRDFSSVQKCNALQKIITKLVVALSDIILDQNTFKNIIDDHQNRANITHLQEKMMVAMILCRDDYHSEFIQRSTKNEGKVGKKAAQQLRDELIDERKRRIKLESDIQRAGTIIAAMNQLHTELTAKLSDTEAELTKTRQKNVQLMANRFQHIDPKPKNEAPPKPKHKHEITHHPATSSSSSSEEPNIMNLTTNDDDPWMQ